MPVVYTDKTGAVAIGTLRMPLQILSNGYLKAGTTTKWPLIMCIYGYLWAS